MRRALGRAGREVIVAPGGAEALEVLRGGKSVDLLVLDHRMNAMDGSELYLEAVALRPQLTGRALIMTGDTLNPSLVTFAAQHGLRLMAKPFDISDLISAADDGLAAPVRQPGD